MMNLYLKEEQAQKNAEEAKLDKSIYNLYENPQKKIFIFDT